jgi:hypothetical protein
MTSQSLLKQRTAINLLRLALNNLWVQISGVRDHPFQCFATIPRSRVTSRNRPNAASELRDLTSQKQSRAHEEAGASKWNYFSLMCK